VAKVKFNLKKNNAEMLNKGSLDFMFSRKAIFEFDKTDDMDIDEIELELIDAGLEEIEEEDGLILAHGDYKDFGNLSHAFEKLNIKLKKATLERMANTPAQFTEDQLKDIQKIVERVEDDDDVQAVYTNIG